MKTRMVFFPVIAMLTPIGSAGAENDQPLPPPFALTSQQQAEIDQLLRDWEQAAADVKMFEWSFTRWEYDPIFGPPNQAKCIDKGTMKYAPPKKWSYCVRGPRAQHLICNGQSLFVYDNRQKRFIEHTLPATKWSQGDTGGLFAFFSLVGKAMLDGPLQSLLFTSEPSKLKDRYFLRIVTPAEAKNQVRLEAYPRFKEDAGLFQRAELILATGDMQPYALQIHRRNAKARTVFLLRRIETDETWPADTFMPGLSSD